jgi:uncharacterized protein YraI
MRATGIDISQHNGVYTIMPNPPTLVNFVIQRLSYVGSASLQLTKDGGIETLTPPVLVSPLKGAYHYVASFMDWKPQSDFFIGLMNGQYDFWAWDVEKTFNANTTAFINGIIPALEYNYNVTKKPGLLYMNPDMWTSWLQPIQNDILALLARTDVRIGSWIAHYRTNPNPEAESTYWKISGCGNMPRNWTFLQYAADSTSPLGHEYGVGSKSIDLDVFNGDVDKLSAWVKQTSVTPPPPPPPIPVGVEYALTVEALNLRSGPSSTYDLVRVIYKSGQPTVWVLPETLKNNYVQLSDLSGWIFFSYIKPVIPIPPSVNIYVVNIPLANIRQGPGSNFPVVGTAPRGTEYIISKLETINYYTKVAENKWIYGIYLSKKT